MTRRVEGEVPGPDNRSPNLAQARKHLCSGPLVERATVRDRTVPRGLGPATPAGRPPPRVPLGSPPPRRRCPRARRRPGVHGRRLPAPQDGAGRPVPPLAHSERRRS